MKEITGKMYTNLYNGIFYKIEVCIHGSLHEQTEKYSPMVSIMRQLRTLITF
jgi:hypothetical protein